MCLIKIVSIILLKINHKLEAVMPLGQSIQFIDSGAEDLIGKEFPLIFVSR